MKKLVGALMLLMFTLHASPGMADTERTLLVSAISGPEKNLERKIMLDIDQGSIKGLVVVTPGAKDQVIPYEDLGKSFVPIVAVAGIDAFLIHGRVATANTYTISLRYLSKAPGELKTFELTLAKNSENQWRLFDPKQGSEANWIHLKARTFMGITIGIESYELSQLRPQI